MEGKITEFQAEEVQGMYTLMEEFLLFENSKNNQLERKMTPKNAEELAQEEELLTLNLDKLKKENFVRQKNINAWQNTLTNKLHEFKETGLKLDKIYNEIWSEREKFCTEANKFNLEYGIFSDWWETQMNFLSDLENLEKKKTDDKTCRREIEKLEKEIEDIKKEIDDLQTKTQLAEVEVHSSAGDTISVRSESLSKDMAPERQLKKKIISEAEDQIKSFEEEEKPVIDNDLYSMVDVEKVRTANRKRNRRNIFLGKVKTFLSK